MNTPSIPRLDPTRYQASNVLITKQILVCPEGAGALVRNSGCVTCRECGWGRCG